jgi:TetR/AcrR family transcriptional repressor of nem operon
MAKPNPAVREALLDCAQQLMLARGYTATTVDQICEAVSVTKGTFFHYFKTKEELGKAALERFRQGGAKLYQQAPFLKESDPLKRVFGFIDFTIELCQHPVRNSCLVGMFSQELADSNPAMRALCGRAFEERVAGLKAMLDQARRKHAPRVHIDTQGLAEQFVATFEGALILAKARDNVAPVATSLRHYKRYLKALFTGLPARRARSVQ